MLSEARMQRLPRRRRPGRPRPAHRQSAAPHSIRRRHPARRPRPAGDSRSRSPAAEVVNVGKRCGTKSITQEEINALMIDHARAGRKRCPSQERRPAHLRPRRRRDRRARLLPRFPSRSSPASLPPSLLLPPSAAPSPAATRASNVIFSTGHHAQSHNDAAMPQLEDATRVVYMPGRDLRLLASSGSRKACRPISPARLFRAPAQPDQQIRHTTLAALGDAEPAPAPSLLIAGWAVRESPLPQLLR